MNIKTLITGPIDVNTYILSGACNNDCIVIDPGAKAPVLDYLNKNSLNCTHILLTHGHFDHIMGVAGLKQQTGAKVMIHMAEAGALENDKLNLGAFSGIAIEHCEVDTKLTDGMEFDAAGIHIRVMHTPGHSPGSVCYILEDERLIFTGDLIFRLSVGRTDLLGSNEPDLCHSILNKLYVLQGNYRLLPGHMRESTLDFERLHNPYTKNMPL